MKPRLVLILGIVLVIVTSALWHGPVGGGAARTIAQTESLARYNLSYFEMDEITPFLERGPVTRRLWLSGEADDFQQAELARILDELPTVSDVQWVEAPSNQPERAGQPLRGEIVLPLIVEIELLGIASFALGIAIAYFIARHRRRERNRYI